MEETPSDEALAAAREIEANHVWGRQEQQRINERAAMIDRHFARMRADSARIDKLEAMSHAATNFEEGVRLCSGFPKGVLLINPLNMRAAIDVMPPPPAKHNAVPDVEGKA